MPIKDPEKKRERQRRYPAQYYANNKELVIARTRASRNKRKKEWEEFKRTLSCSVCGFSHPAAMDFHHLPGTKKAGVHKLTQNGRFTEAYEEIKNCIVLCANCHRIHHYEESQDRKRRRRKKKKGAEAP